MFTTTFSANLRRLIHVGRRFIGPCRTSTSVQKRRHLSGLTMISPRHAISCSSLGQHANFIHHYYSGSGSDTNSQQVQNNTSGSASGTGSGSGTRTRSGLGGHDHHHHHHGHGGASGANASGDGENGGYQNRQGNPENPHFPLRQGLKQQEDMEEEQDDIDNADAVEEDSTASDLPLGDDLDRARGTGTKRRYTSLNCSTNTPWMKRQLRSRLKLSEMSKVGGKQSRKHASVTSSSDYDSAADCRSRYKGSLLKVSGCLSDSTVTLPNSDVEEQTDPLLGDDDTNSHGIIQANQGHYGCDDIPTPASPKNWDTENMPVDFENFDQGSSAYDWSADDGTDDDDDDGDQDISSTSYNQRQRLITIQTYANRHCLDNSALSDFMMVLKCLSPTAAEGLPTTASGIRKHLLLEKVKTTFKYNCALCNSGLMANSCRHSGIDTYVYVSFEDQLKLKFEDSSFVEGLKWRFNREAGNQCISDVYDSALYKHYVETGFLSEGYNLSWKLSIDGVPISHSSNVSAWPVLLKPNEVPPAHRRQHTLLVALYVGGSKPDLAFLLQDLFLTINRLQAEGIGVYLPNGSLVNSKSLLFSVHADLPAKAALLNMNQFNGASCCLNCYSTGQNLRTAAGGNVRVIPYSEPGLQPLKLRTHEEVVRDGDLAIGGKKVVNGIKGKSVLLLLHDFDLVKSTAIDYMHQCLLGITRGLMKNWFDSSNHSKEWYCGKKTQRQVIDRKLLYIKPPSYIARAPRSISQLSYWKASEFRNFLLFYLVPCMKDVLPTMHLQHVSLLACGVYLCCKNNISAEEIKTSAGCFREFVALTAPLYFDKLMGLNVHSLLHLADMVKNLGSLHDNSNFDFEDMMGDVKKSVHGTQYMPNQIVNNILMKQFTSKLGSELDGHHRSVFDKLMKTRGSADSDESSEKWFVLGQGQKASRSTKDILQKANEPVYGTCTEFLRIKRKKTIFTCKKYKRQKRRVNYAVEYIINDIGYFGLLDTFVRAHKSAQTVAIVQELKKIDEKLINGNIILDRYHNTEVETTDRCWVIPLHAIKEKVIYIEVEQPSKRAVVCRSPNNTEFLA